MQVQVYPILHIPNELNDLTRFGRLFTINNPPGLLPPPMITTCRGGVSFLKFWRGPDDASPRA